MLPASCPCHIAWTPTLLHHAGAPMPHRVRRSFSFPNCRLLAVLSQPTPPQWWRQKVEAEAEGRGKSLGTPVEATAERGRGTGEEEEWHPDQEPRGLSLIPWGLNWPMGYQLYSPAVDHHTNVLLAKGLMKVCCEIRQIHKFRRSTGHHCPYNDIPQNLTKEGIMWMVNQ